MISPFVNIFDIKSLFAAELQEPKIGIWGKGLILYNINATYNDSVKRKSFLETLLQRF